MIKKLIKKLYLLKQYKFKLPFFYLLLIFFGLLTLIIPGLNECSGGLFVICFPISLIIIVLLGAPGNFIIERLNFIIPREYYSWSTHSENLSRVVVFNYIVTLIFLYFLGLIIDKARERKKLG